MRGIITGIAVICYAAAIAIAAAALGLPVPKPAAKKTHERPAAAQAPPSSAAPGPALAAVAKAAPPSPIPPPAAQTAPEEVALLQRAQKFQQAGELKKAEAIYLRLMQQGAWRDTAAQRLGDLYFKAGDFRRAEQMYRESARLIRARPSPAPAPAPR